MRKRKLNDKSNLFSFLNSSGILENGTHNQIQKVRAEYWREYKRKWRNAKRKSEKEITISFTQDEFKEISNESKRHKLSRTQFIKKACFAYINKIFIVPDSKEVKRIAQQLSMTYNSIPVSYTHLVSDFYKKLFESKGAIVNVSGNLN